MKNSGSFHISAQNIDCGLLLEPPLQGGSYEFPQSMFLSNTKKLYVYNCKHQFFCIKLGFQGVITIQVCFRDGNCLNHHIYFADLLTITSDNYPVHISVVMCLDPGISCNRNHHWISCTQCSEM